jgi:hypothetical protein
MEEFSPTKCYEVPDLGAFHSRSLFKLPLDRRLQEEKIKGQLRHENESFCADGGAALVTSVSQAPARKSNQ